MRYIILTTLFFICTWAYSQDLPYRSSILRQMNLANDYFMAKWPDPTANIVTDKTRPSNIWTRATYYEGMMQLYYLSKDTDLYNYAVTWGAGHSWLAANTNTTTQTNADYICCFQTYIELYLLDKTKTARISNVKTNMDYIIATKKTNYWWWIDAIHMAMPIFAKMGVLYNDTTYYNALYRYYYFPRYQTKSTGLYSSTYNLWYRDSIFLTKKTTAGKPVFWSRGNGWVIAALTRTLDVLPTTASHRSEFVTMYKNLASSILALQRSDGFWNPCLNDSTYYGGKETSGTAMFTYAFAWGIRNGYLDSATYFPAVRKAWAGMIDSSLHSTGFLGYMQGTGDDPSDSQPVTYNSVPNFEDYGLGAFLLAGSEVYRLAKDSTASQTTVVSSSESSGGTNISASPNPFSDQIQINYTCESSNPEIVVYNLKGEKVAILLQQRYKAPGKYSINWNGKTTNGSTLSSGLYFIALTDGKVKKQVKIQYIK